MFENMQLSLRYLYKVAGLKASAFGFHSDGDN
jgi:hypothetical protein